MIEIRLHLKSGGAGQLELLRCLLIRAGVPLEKISEKSEKGKFSLSVFVDSAAQARPVTAALRGFRLKDVTFSLVVLKDSDWKTRWKKYFKPFNITRDIRIIPVWELEASAPDGVRGIRIDTTSAFGTGLHATTQMVSLLIRKHKDSIHDFLDIGTGSGILSLIAHSYGARNIWAMDNDGNAVATARKNFRRNNCPDTHLKTADFARFTTARRFDFVAANLFTEDLVRFRRKLTALVKPGGFLAVSGIFHENYPSFDKRFRAAGLRRLEVMKRKKWYAVLFRKG